MNLNLEFQEISKIIQIYSIKGMSFSLIQICNKTSKKQNITI